MKKVLIILLVLVAAMPMRGQKKTIDYQERYVQLYKEYSRNPDNVVNLIAMAGFFADSLNPQYYLPLAKGYISKAEELYTARVQDPKSYSEVHKLIRKGVTITTIREQSKQIERQAEAYVLANVQTIRTNEANALLDVFPKNSVIVKHLRSKALEETYARACVEGTLQAYYAFLQANPVTRFTDSVEARIFPLAARQLSTLGSEEEIDSLAAVYGVSRAVQQAAVAQKSRMAFAQACRANTVDSYSSYLEKYPRGVDYLEALARLQQLRDVDYGSISSVQDLADFAESHVDDPLADSALARIRQMIVQNHDVAAAQLYLEKFPLDQGYYSIFKEYYSWFSAEGNLQPVEAFAAKYPDYPYQLAVSSDIEQGRKIDAFDLSKPFVESDFDTLSTVIRLLTGRRIAFVALQRVLQQQIAKKDWASAKRRMQKFELSFEDFTNQEYNELFSLLSNNPGPATQLQLTADSISHAIMHPSGAMYFTRRHHGHNAIFYAKHTPGKKGGWKLDGKVTVEGTASDVVAYNFFDNGTQVLLGMGGDIWTARVLNDTVWRLDQHLPNPVNTPSLEKDAFMLADGTGLLLVSDRPGGHNMQQSGAYFHGDHKPATDIYFIPFTSGRWGDAINLGITVNSPYCELSPILSRNMRTLYFATDASGLGYADVYCATRSDIDDWTHWSQPVNMGRNVNGAFDESAVTFFPDERHILLSSRSPQGGQPSVYTFATQHDTTSAYRTVQVDLRTVRNVLRNIDLALVWRNQTTGHLTDRQVDSVMTYRLYKNKDYAILAESDWLYIPTLYIDGAATGELSLQAYGIDQLKSMPNALPLPLVRFYEGTSRLLSLAETELRHLGRFMQQRTTTNIEIEVNVEGTDDSQCYDLSLERAKAIRAFLVDYGVDASRIRLSAYGNVRHKTDPSQVGVGIRFF